MANAGVAVVDFGEDKNYLEKKKFQFCGWLMKLDLQKKISERETYLVYCLLMLCAPSKRRQPFLYHTKMTDFDYFPVLSVFF